MDVKCDCCGVSFKRKSKDKRTKKSFCSLQCYWKDKRTLPDIPCLTCLKLFRPTAKGRPYCCRECYDASRGEEVKKVCVGCKNEFSVKKSIENRYNYCSLSCKRSFSESFLKDCATCGRPFRQGASDLARGLIRKHCSEECRRPVHTFSCETCGKVKRRCPSDSARRFCCLSCYRKSGSATSLEIAVSECLKSLGIEFSPEHKVGRYSIDFAIMAERIAVEADGSYWHNESKDKKRDAALLSLGWVTARVPELEFLASSDKASFVMDKIIAARSQRHWY